MVTIPRSVYLYATEGQTRPVINSLYATNAFYLVLSSPDLPGSYVLTRILKICATSHIKNVSLYTVVDRLLFRAIDASGIT